MSVTPVDMHGRVCLVTGANRGIGRATCRALADMGATVGLAVRDEEMGREALDGIASGTGNDDLHLFVADLAVQKQVRALAQEVRSTFDRLDVLVNNAGGIFGHHEITPDGVEHTFAVDHIAPFILTHELLPLLRASAPARVVTVASEAHQAGHIDFDDINLERGFSAWRAYNQAKLANVLFTRELARRLDGTGVTANCLHPGVVHTGFGREGPWWLRGGVKMLGPFLRSPQKGAETVVYLASSPEVANVSGEYFIDMEPGKPSKRARDDGTARRLWDLSAEMSGLDETI